MAVLKVIDFFCGAGGFSEGFSQQGFEIVRGFDNWKPAVDTYNHNFNNKGIQKNILDFEKSIEEIELLPNTEIIIGSPPCVSFSNSNRSGKADKSMGLRLTEVFLRIVAIKKYQVNSVLKVWLMENVPNSLKFIKKQYTFEDLNLAEWAKSNRLDPEQIALRVDGNSVIVNSADYGSPQMRKRAVTGEFIGFGQLLVPKRKFGDRKDNTYLPNRRTLKQIKDALPSPYSYVETGIVTDPMYNYPIFQKDLSDHFYDPGLYECEWKCSRFHKINHPYMGKMSFPENQGEPSRTICATNIGTSRESLIYKSEVERIGDGEYRTPTVREAATIMGFPISFQFAGLESSKWRLVGNAVSPCVSRAFAESIRDWLGLAAVNIKINKTTNLSGVTSLNTFALKEFNTPPRKKAGSRFRRHPFKYGNITVTLSNYDIMENETIGKWITSVQYGNGDGFPTINYPDDYFFNLEDTIKEFECGEEFLTIINNGFSKKVADAKTLQDMYEGRAGRNGLMEPTELIEKVASIINGFTFDEETVKMTSNGIFQKEIVPKKQFMALYAINKVSSIANRP